MTTNDKIYVVQGCTGEYSDRSEWIVGASLDKVKADDLCDRLNAWCKERKADENGWEVFDEQGERIWNPQCPLDPDFQNGYTGTKYTVQEVKIITTE